MRVIIPLVWALAMLATRFADPLPVITAVAVSLASIVAWRERLSLRPLLRVTPRIALLSVAATAAMIAVTYAAFPLLVRWIPVLGTETQVIYARFVAGRTLAVLIAGVVPVVVAEELLWRGSFQGSLTGAGVLVAALIYGAAHAPSGSMLLVVVALVCGLYWSALRAISGSLIPPLCAHLAWDIALIVFPLTR